MADSSTTADEYPLFLELKSIRGALARFQEEAHASAVKLQRHSLDTARTHERAVHLERENDLLKAELAVLRASPHPDSTSASQTHVQELTLSLRKLSQKMSLTEEKLLQSTTAIVSAQADSMKARAALDAAYELGARVRGREETGKAKERDLEWQIRKLEEQLKMSDVVVGEYAALVRGMEARNKSSDSNGHVDEMTLASTLGDGKLSLERVVNEFQAQHDELSQELDRTKAELEVTRSQLYAGKKGEDTVVTELGRTKTELEKLKVDDGTAAKMVARYMQFSQSSTNGLLTSLETLKARHNATLSTLSAQNHMLSSQLRSLETQNEHLRDILDDLGGEIMKEKFGRRREVGLRIRMGGREERVVEGLRRWVRRGDEAIKRLKQDETATDVNLDAVQSNLQTSLFSMSQDARILLESLEEGGADEETAISLSGARGREIMVRDGIEGLLEELRLETEKRVMLEVAAKSLSLGDVLLEDVPPQVPEKTPIITPATLSPASPPKRSVTEDDPMPSLTEHGETGDHETPPALSTAIPEFNSEANAIIKGSQSTTSSNPSHSDDVQDGHLATDVDPISIAGIDDVPIADIMTSNHPEPFDVLEPSPPATPVDSPAYEPLAGHPTSPSPEVTALIDVPSMTTILDSTPDIEPMDAPISALQLTEPSDQIHPPDKSELHSPSVSGDEANSVSLPSSASSTSMSTSADTLLSEPYIESPSDSALEKLQPVDTIDIPPRFNLDKHASKTLSTSQAVPSDADATLTTIHEETPKSQIIYQEPPKPIPHPLLAKLGKVSKRYDDLQRAFRDCHLALEGLKTSLLSPQYAPAAQAIPADILTAAVGRLDDYTEDVRVELEIRIGDEALLAKGYEALVSVPGALADDSKLDEDGLSLGDSNSPSETPTTSEVEKQIEDFVAGSDSATRKARETFVRKLEDVQHDIAALKRAVHDPESLVDGQPPAPLSESVSTSNTSENVGGWTSWIRGTPSRPSTPTPSAIGPSPTFGNIMTAPRLKHSPSLGATQLSAGVAPTSAQPGRSRRGSFFGLGGLASQVDSSSARNPLEVLGLKIPMPSFTVPNFGGPSSGTYSSPSSAAFGGYSPSGIVSPTYPSPGLGPMTTPRARTVSTMYMLGLGAAGGSRSPAVPGRVSRSVSANAVGSMAGLSSPLGPNSTNGSSAKDAEVQKNTTKVSLSEKEDEDDSDIE